MPIITSFTVVEVIAIVIAIILVALLLIYGKSRHRKAFVFFLTVFTFWSFVSLMANTGLPFEEAVFWGKYAPVLALGAAVSYTYFITIFAGKTKETRVIAWGGAGVIALLLVLAILGYIPKEFTLLDNGIVVRKGYGAWHYFMTLSGFAFLGTAIYVIWKKANLRFKN